MTVEVQCQHCQFNYSAFAFNYISVSPQKRTFQNFRNPKEKTGFPIRAFMVTFIAYCTFHASFPKISLYIPSSITYARHFKQYYSAVHSAWRCLCNYFFFLLIVVCEEKAVDESSQLNIYYQGFFDSRLSEGIPNVQPSLKIASWAMIH